MGSRSLSGLLVFFFGYWTTLLLGFIKSPGNFKNAFQVTAIVLLAIGTFVGTRRFQRSHFATSFTHCSTR